MFKTDTIKITAEMLSLISSLDEFKGAWTALGRLAPERLSALKRVATIESIGSSTRIEGNKLSNTEIEKLLSNIDIRSFETRDEQEVAGYSEVMDIIFQNANDIPFTENHIKQLHRDLLKYSNKDERHRGEYKTNTNHVEAFDQDGKSLGVVFETATPFDTPRLMQELIEWVLKSFKEKILHPLLVIGIFVVIFLEIHPFQDGNGRLSRVLTTLLLLRSGYSYVPYSSLESIIEQSKDAYYLSLRKTQGTIRTDNPNWQPWVLFFLKALDKQKQNLEKKIEREKIILGQLPELSLQIIEFIKSHGRATISDIEKTTGANRNTIKKHLSQLVEDQHIIKNGAGRGVWYSVV